MKRGFFIGVYVLIGLMVIGYEKHNFREVYKISGVFGAFMLMLSVAISVDTMLLDNRTFGEDVKKRSELAKRFVAMAVPSIIAGCLYFFV